ncbi:polysaccharide pyruvyl transferase family protein, partial [Algiphilus sp. NNCM1]|nr:polysaccharide pyruvyl transferase family protein [Algiphilus acroporae]
MSEERLEAFQRFNKNMCIGVVNFDEFNPKEYTFFSVGSDQVWNLGYIKYNEDWFFLDFAKKEQRVALAPSIGLDALDERQSRRLAKGVRNFPLLSVREERGAELIYEASGMRAEVICDPTL